MLLRTFLEIVGSGCFAAAERPALTPSAVSEHMRRLEQIAGVGLLARTTRRLDLVFGKQCSLVGGRIVMERAAGLGLCAGAFIAGGPAAAVGGLPQTVRLS
ncbi:LysR family transcriptional regulator [Pseudomonas aeruginosa]|nr:LysR family transcriptional regulator [Pseudomonas aeruginosa]MDI2459791.1 LysR family transcriptional regulator [Pseudomonas aeruginosa]